MSDNDKVTKNGQTLTQRVWDLIEYTGTHVGKSLMVAQGGFKEGSGASASGSTHDKGDVFDLRVVNLTDSERLAVVDILRSWSGCAWLRSPKYGWTSTGPHIHCVMRDSFYGLSSGAKWQVSEYDHHRNGLSGTSSKPDPFPHPEQRHYTKAPPVIPPGPPAPINQVGDKNMVVTVTLDKTTFWLISSGKTVSISNESAKTWTGDKITITDATTWGRMTAAWPVQK